MDNSNPLGPDVKGVENLSESMLKSLKYWFSKREAIIDKLKENRKDLSKHHKSPVYSPSMELKKLFQKFSLNNKEFNSSSDWFNFLNKGINEVKKLKIKDPDIFFKKLDVLTYDVLKKNEEVSKNFTDLISELKELDSRVSPRLKELVPDLEVINSRIENEYLGYTGPRADFLKADIQRLKDKWNSIDKSDIPQSIEKRNELIDIEDVEYEDKNVYVSTGEIRKIRSNGKDVLHLGLLLLFITIITYFLMTGDPIQKIKKMIIESFNNVLSSLKKAFTEKDFLKILKSLLVQPFIEVFEIMKKIGPISLLGLVGFVCLVYGLYTTYAINWWMPEDNVKGDL